MAFAPIDPAELAAFHTSLNAPVAQAAAKPKGNFLTHLIPSLGGTGGAVGGAALGTAIAPGIGTLIGALLGGAAGGGASKVGENALEHQSLGSGVAGQALEQGILGAGPVRLLKGAAVGSKALLSGAASGAEGNTLANALAAAGNAATKPGVLSTALNTSKQTATDRLAAGQGFGVGQTLNGKTILPNQSQSIQDFLKSRAGLYGGITPGTPISQAAQAQALHDNVTAALSGKLGEINRAVTPEETSGVARAMQTAAVNNPALANANLAPLSLIAQHVTNATDLKGLEGARMAADKLAYTNGTDVGSSQLAQQGAHARDAIDQFVSASPQGATPAEQKAIAEYKAIKGDYGNSKDLVQATAKANNSAEGIHVPLLGGKVGDQVVSGMRNKVNAKLAGDVSTGTNPYGVKAVAARNIGTGSLIDALTSASTQNNNTPSATGTPGTDLTDALNNALQGISTAAPQDTTNDPNNPFSQQNIEQAIANDIASTGGKNTSTLISLYNTFGKPDAAAQALTTNQKNEVVSQNRALGSLNAYVQQLQGAGGAEGPLKGAINGSILGNYTNPQAKGIDAQRIDVASAIAGSLNPRGTVSPVTARIISAALPSIHDSPKTAQAKIANLITQIKSGAYSGDTPVSQLISNSTGQ